MTKATTTRPGAAKEGEGDLAILFPDRTRTIAGVTLTMREYGLVESLLLDARIQRVAEALGSAAQGGAQLTAAALRPVFAQCHDDVVELIAAACDQPVPWVANLRAADGQPLLMLWWVVNADFFVQRVIESIAVARILPKESGGPTSLQPSQPQATPSTGSANTAGDN